MPDEAFYAAVHEWRTSTVLSEREKLAIEYAEKVGLDPKALATDEDFWARYKAALSDDEIVDLAFRALPVLREVAGWPNDGTGAGCKRNEMTTPGSWRRWESTTGSTS